MNGCGVTVMKSSSGWRYLARVGAWSATGEMQTRAGALARAIEAVRLRWSLEMTPAPEPGTLTCCGMKPGHCVCGGETIR